MKSISLELTTDQKYNTLLKYIGKTINVITSDNKTHLSIVSGINILGFESETNLPLHKYTTIDIRLIDKKGTMNGIKIEKLDVHADLENSYFDKVVHCIKLYKI